MMLLYMLIGFGLGILVGAFLTACLAVVMLYRREERAVSMAETAMMTTTTTPRLVVSRAEPVVLRWPNQES